MKSHDVIDDPFAEPKVVPLHPNGAGGRPKYPFPDYGPDEIAGMPAANLDWVVRGVLAPGCVTELTGDLKAGKTTFIAELVRAMREGRPFLGLATRPAHVTWLTEQPPTSFLQAMQRAHLADCGVDEICVIFRQDTFRVQWPGIVASCVAADQRRGGGGVLVVDTLSRFVGVGPDQENDAAFAARAMDPLLAASKAGMAVQVLRHARKAGGDVATAGRGSGAWSADVDVMLLLRRPPKDGNGEEEHLATASRTRLLEAASRFSETPAQEEPVTIALTEDGYGILDGSRARQQRFGEMDEQILLYVASHAGCTKTDVKGSPSIRGKDNTKLGRVAELVQAGKLEERATERPQLDGRTRTVAGLYVGPLA